MQIRDIEVLCAFIVVRFHLEFHHQLARTIEFAVSKVRVLKFPELEEFLHSLHSLFKLFTTTVRFLFLAYSLPFENPLQEQSSVLRSSSQINFILGTAIKLSRG